MHFKRVCNIECNTGCESEHSTEKGVYLNSNGSLKYISLSISWIRLCEKNRNVYLWAQKSVFLFKNVLCVFSWKLKIPVIFHQSTFSRSTSSKKNKEFTHYYVVSKKQKCNTARAISIYVCVTNKYVEKNNNTWFWARLTHTWTPFWSTKRFHIRVTLNFLNLLRVCYNLNVTRSNGHQISQNFFGVSRHIYPTLVLAKRYWLSLFWLHFICLKTIHRVLIG